MKRKRKKLDQIEAKTVYPPPGKPVDFHPGWKDRFNVTRSKR